MDVVPVCALFVGVVHFFGELLKQALWSVDCFVGSVRGNKHFVVSVFVLYNVFASSVRTCANKRKTDVAWLREMESVL